MKKIIYFMVIFSLCYFILIYPVLSVCTPCCCQTYPGSGQYRCYNSGECCRKGTIWEFWDPNSCFKFNFWIEPKVGRYTIGTETPINLYIQNVGAYADDYIIIANSSNPTLFMVDMSAASPVNNVNIGEIRRVYPILTVMATGVSGSIFFNATSQGDENVFRNATLTILKSNLPMSLPEFDFFSLLGIIIIIFIYYKKLQGNKK